MTDIAAERRVRGRQRGDSGAPSTVQALDRGLRIMAALADQDETPLTDLALRTGLPASTAHRLLATLEHHGYVEFDPITQGWSIGAEAHRIGAAFLRRSNIVAASGEAMRLLLAETGETANLAIPEGAEVIFVAQMESHHPIRAFFRPGARAAMYCSGIGKAILSALPRAEAERRLARVGLDAFTPNTLTRPADLWADLDLSARRGWAVDDEERYLGMRCVAAPIFAADGEPVGGLSVSGPTVRLSDTLLAEIGPRVRRLASDVSARLGAQAA
ncbi:MAG: IclR family transcriptional regulator [Pseudomonadota bacterium]